jgi:hypothetical protein
MISNAGYASYVLRLRNMQNDCQATWLASLQSTATGEQRSFPSVEALATYLLAEFGSDLPDDFNLEQASNVNSRNYQICVEGQILPAWLDRLQGMSVAGVSESPGGCVTTLTAEFADQRSLLLGVRKLHDLQLTLLSVRFLDADDAMVSCSPV